MCLNALLVYTCLFVLYKVYTTAKVIFVTIFHAALNVSLHRESSTARRPNSWEDQEENLLRLYPH